MTKFEKLQHYLLSLPLGSGEEERQRKADLFGGILTKAGFRCIYTNRIVCEPEMDCKNCLMEKPDFRKLVTFRLNAEGKV